MSDEFDPYYAWLGIPPKDQPPNHYRLLGLDLFETNLDVIESAAFRQMGHVRTYQSGQHSRESQRPLNELSAAKISLLDSDKKRDYDELLRATIESIKTFLPEEPGTDPTAHQTSKSGTSSIHVIDFRLQRNFVRISGGIGFRLGDSSQTPTTGFTNSNHYRVHHRRGLSWHRGHVRQQVLDARTACRKSAPGSG